MAKTEVQKCLDIVENFRIECDNTDVLIDCFRCLRDYCASGRLAQNEIANNVNVIKKTKALVEYWSLHHKNEKDLSLLVALQFVANFLVENINNQRVVWLLFSADLFQIICCCEPKIQNCAAMIIYNILLDNNCFLQDCYENFDNILALTQHEVTAEYTTFIIELFICTSQFIEVHYAALSDKNKLTVLSIIETLQKHLNGRQFPLGLFEFLSRYAANEIKCVVTNVHSEADELKVIEVTTVLQILNNACTNPRYLEEVQSVSELLSTVIEVLGAVHLLSKEKGNQFSMLLKLADVEAMEGKENSVNKNPVFGFKGSLVRLIGNMCWHSKKHQDLARELGGIPLILDCCNIDARNPFIIQWAVLAMRNLCENNVENQKTVACIDHRGPLDTSRLAQLDLFSASSTQKNSS